jgi:hypothetical protein
MARAQGISKRVKCQRGNQISKYYVGKNVAGALDVISTMPMPASDALSASAESSFGGLFRLSPIMGTGNEVEVIMVWDTKLGDIAPLVSMIADKK